MVALQPFDPSTSSGLSVKLVDPPAVGQVDWRGRINYFFIEKLGHSTLQFVLILIVL